MDSGAASSSLARRIHERAHLTGSFRLSSGIVSHEYFDKYLFEADPVLLREVAEALVAVLPDEVDALAGLELGGVPLATMASQLTGLPARFVRKAAKAYGTANVAEGGDVRGLRLAIVEDVVTSGGQVLEATAALRALGARISVVACVIDREEGGAANLAAEGLELRAVVRMSELQAS